MGCGASGLHLSLPSFGAAVQHFLQERRGGRREAHTAAILSLMGEAQERRRRRGIFPLLLPGARSTDRPTEGGGPGGGRSLVGAARGGEGGGLLLFP